MPTLAFNIGRKCFALVALVVVSLAAVPPPSVAAAAAPVESGRASITDQWTTVSITGSFVDPVVVAGAATETEADPGNVEIRAVTPTSFEIRFREWEYLDSVHASEMVTYLVAERGVTELTNGRSIEAGTIDLTQSWLQINFAADFGGSPSFITTVAENPAGPMAPRVKSLNSSSVQLRQWNEEDGSAQPDASANWIAWSKGSGDAATDGIDWEADTFRTDERLKTLTFDGQYADACVVAAISSPTSNPVSARSSEWASSSVALRAVEEQSRDAEVGLTNEIFGYVVLECGTGPVPDLVSPTWEDPTAVATNIASSTVTLDWSPGATDDVGIARYRIFQDGAEVASTSSQAVTVGGLTPLTSYDFSISAEDAAGNLASAMASITVTTVDAPPLPLSVGNIQLSSNWAEITLDREFVDPVVVLGPATETDAAPGVVEIRAVTSQSFQARFSEWDYLDGDHGLETVSFLVAERGVTTLPSGARIEAGTMQSSESSTQSESFTTNFSDRPTFISTVVDRTGPSVVAPRIATLSPTYVRHRLWVQETNSERPTNDLNWVAWESGSNDGGLDGLMWETGSLTTDERYKTETFSAAYSNACIFADVRSNAPNPSTVRRSALTETSVLLRVAEEQSKDTETGLGNEVLPWLVTACAAVPTSEDLSPPTWLNATVEATMTTAEALRLSWGPEAGDLQGGEYVVLVDGLEVATSSTTTAFVPGLSPSTTYAVKIEARDLTGNTSEDGPGLAVTTAEAVAPAASITGVPFGSFLNLDNVNDRFANLTAGRFLFGSPEEAIQYLELARATDTQLVIALVQTQQMKFPDGSLDIEFWKAGVDRFADVDFRPYVDDGTIIGHYIIDEPKAGSWGGEVVPNAVIDELAGYSKAYWPYMPTITRNAPERLIRHALAFNDPGPEPYEWQHLDIAWLQYSQANHGGLVGYTEDQVLAAQQQDLGMIFGLQLLSGGNGSSNIHPDAPLNTSRWIMSYNEVLSYGEYLLQQQASCAFITFRWDRNEETYFAPGTALRSAHDDLQALAANATPQPCGLRR